ncbi:MAG: hypothetical protein ABIY63_03705, partial [Fibrobacteria bacterium]
SAGLVFDKDVEGRFFVRTPAGILIAELYKPQGRIMELGLPPGRYAIRVEQEKSLASASIELSEGQRHTLTAGDLQPLSKDLALQREKGGETGAATATLIDNDSTRGFGMSMSDQVDLNMRAGMDRSYSLSLGLLLNRQKGPYHGLQLSFFFNQADALWGGQIDLFGNLVRGPLDGFQLSVLGNLALDSVHGLQLTPLVNVAKGSVTGGQGASVLNIAAGPVQGGQGAGLLNVSGDSVSGGQGAGILNIAAGPVKGGQGAGIVNAAAGPLKGGQGAGVLNVVAGDVKGGQGAGVLNAAWGSVRGGQGAGVTNLAWGPVHGAQVAGVLNVAKGVEGAQVAGVLNASAGTRGAQVAGVANLAVGDVKGAQTAGVMNAARDVKGAQVAAVFNAARDVNGSQIGLVNVSHDIRNGIPFGLINYSHTGLHSVNIWSDELGFQHVGLLSGSRNFYTYLSAGDEVLTSGHALALGAGMGVQVPFGPWFGAADLGVTDIHYDYDFDGHGPELYNLTLTAGRQLFPYVSVFAGLSWNVFWTQGDGLSLPIGGYQNKWADDVYVWPGLRLGLRLGR